VDIDGRVPAKMTELRVGGVRLPDGVKLRGDQQVVALRHALVADWLDGLGVANEGYEIGRILLARAGGDLEARVIDLVD
jgi:hypothetical protein